VDRQDLFYITTNRPKIGCETLERNDFRDEEGKNEMAEMIGSDVGIARPKSRKRKATGPSKPRPLEIREQNGSYQVKADNGSWIRCGNKDDAEALSTIGALTTDACSDASAGRRFVVRLEKSKELLTKYGVLKMAKWFGERVDHFRTLETLDW
jgi:hypothetical protein